MSGKKIIVTAEIPEEFLEDWRVFVVIRGGKVLVPRPKSGKVKKEEAHGTTKTRRESSAGSEV